MSIAKKRDNDYLDPQEELRKKGIYYITGEIDTDDLIDIHQDILLKHLDTKWKDDIQLIINTVGGSCAEGWALIDLLKWVKMGVRTTGMGECYSLGALLLAVGDKGNRTAAANCSIMIHGGIWGIEEANQQQLVARAKWWDDEYKRDLNFWVEHTNLNEKEVKEKLLHGTDVFLNSEEAHKLGIVDHVQYTAKRKPTRKKK